MWAQTPPHASNWQREAPELLVSSFPLVWVYILCSGSLLSSVPASCPQALLLPPQHGCYHQSQEMEPLRSQQPCGGGSKLGQSSHSSIYLSSYTMCTVGHCGSTVMNETTPMASQNVLYGYRGQGRMHSRKCTRGRCVQWRKVGRRHEYQDRVDKGFRRVCISRMRKWYNNETMCERRALRRQTSQQNPVWYE